MNAAMSHGKGLKKRIFDIIQIGTRVDIPSTAFDIFIVCMILLSITVTFLQTFDELAAYRYLLNRIEFVTIIIFIVEYILRLYTSDLLYPKKSYPRAILAFVCSFYGLVDLLTIVSYFSVLYSNGIVALRMIRVVRIMRLFKVNKSFDAFNVVAEVIHEKRNQIISSIFMIAMLMLAASLCMYGLEHDVQPDKFNNAFSGIWWAMATLLTVGYGDIYPVTLGGRVVAIFIALLGVCVVAIPTGVISAGFVEYYTRLKRSAQQIYLSEDVAGKLEKLAKRERTDVNTYVERLVLEKEWEYHQEHHSNHQQESGQGHNKKKKR